MLNDCSFTALAEQMTARARRAGPVKAEIIDGAQARWHIIRVQPGREATAVAHLVERGFGLYIPELGVRQKLGRRTVARAERMFPGLIFLSVWDIERHRRRIEGCPGVAGIARHATGAAVCLPDAEIRAFMVLEARSLAALCPRVRSKKSNCVNPDIPEGAVRMSCKSYWDTVSGLDAVGRNQVFRKALALSTSP